MTTRIARISTITGAVAGTALLGAASILLTLPEAQAAPDQGGHDRFPIFVEELEARRAEIFARVDSNGDGLISAEEFTAAEMPKHPRGGPNRRKGGGHHGSPSEEATSRRHEAMAAMEEDLFHALDADADGVISRDEFSSAALRDARRTTMISRMFERADTDGDGYLSPDEFPPRRMANLDANGDGQISRDELPHRAAG